MASCHRPLLTATSSAEITVNRSPSCIRVQLLLSHQSSLPRTLFPFFQPSPRSAGRGDYLSSNSIVTHLRSLRTYCCPICKAITFCRWLLHLLPTSTWDVTYSLHQHRKSSTTCSGCLTPPSSSLILATAYECRGQASTVTSGGRCLNNIMPKRDSVLTILLPSMAVISQPLGEK
ncbi:hypothetical protein B296_00057594 [Ensete ventricosum]|uniref:Uncharacterized protein n=1 Tax=Ensete ventricosum TaxID=4639 RepID=A0A426XB60_ENSVE|nr:hypothetical protein B296_00057594 [Ensete ventricosum]